MSLRILSPGTHTLVVDGGRPRTRSLGIPVGGPSDRSALAIGNALVGNAPQTPALEITLMGPTLIAVRDVGMGVFGAPFQVYRDGEAIEAGHTFTLKEGQTLRTGGTPRGCRAYLCVPGGFRFPKVLDSVTGFKPVLADDILECNSSVLPGRGLGTNPSISEKTVRLRCLPGPQADWFKDAFFSNSYRVTPDCNRMGLRLDGPPLKMPKRELVSEAVAPGAIQITNEGKPIAIGVDGQTIGGYPKVAHIISADIDRLAQLRPGDDVRFQLVSARKAEEFSTKQRVELHELLRRIAFGIG
ncbi:MAG: biotin-dependent carboxyltransferase [Gemmataceae bacterium]|nr:biotin-dependent carboxyltransferase [Gemmataceae bacterium]